MTLTENRSGVRGEDRCFVSFLKQSTTKPDETGLCRQLQLRNEKPRSDCSRGGGTPWAGRHWASWFPPS